MAASYHAHGLAEHPDHGLVSNGTRRREEEEGQSDVEQRQRGQDGLGGDERHGFDRLVSCLPRVGLSFNVGLVVAIQGRAVPLSLLVPLMPPWKPGFVVGSLGR
jgi:hypothetical protein